MNRNYFTKPIKIKGISGEIDMFIVWIVIITIGILVVAIYFGIKTKSINKITDSSEVSMTVDANTYDWGIIDYDVGIVSKNFSIKNTGNTTLQLYNIKTSCMCTTAQLKTPEVTSRKYGMHEKTTGVIEVKPGETANLLVEFDPAFHGPSGLGPITRTVTINTNSTKNSVLTFNLSGTVVKK